MQHQVGGDRPILLSNSHATCVYACATIAAVTHAGGAVPQLYIIIYGAVILNDAGDSTPQPLHPRQRGGVTPVPSNDNVMYIK